MPVPVRIPPALSVWTGRRVLLTGCTGFKGVWLARWLAHLGAEVHGLALEPPTRPSLWEKARMVESMPWHRVDVRDLEGVRRVIGGVRPEAVFHLAAQALVRPSYDDPLGTLQTNTLGTAHLLEAIREQHRPMAVVVVTTDKVYRPDTGRACREDDPLGGEDVYSASKAAAELVTAAWRASFFPAERIAEHGVAVATVRAGNVVGPGDYAPSRLVPHVLGELLEGRVPRLRNPDGVRPWQHVLEPLAGYLALGARLLPDAPERAAFATAFNLGPMADACRPVRDVVRTLQEALDLPGPVARARPDHRREAEVLRLAIDEAVGRLGWRPSYDFGQALVATARGEHALRDARSSDAVRAALDTEIAAYIAAARDAGAAWASEDPHDTKSLSRLREHVPAPGPGPGEHAPGEPGAAA